MDLKFIQASCTIIFLLGVLQITMFVAISAMSLHYAQPASFNTSTIKLEANNGKTQNDYLP